MKSLVTRTITAVFFVAALVGCMIWSELSFTFFFALVAGYGSLGVLHQRQSSCRSLCQCFHQHSGSHSFSVCCEPMQFTHAQLRFLPPLRGHTALSPHQRTLST